jgi:hypothetical protein
MKTIKKTFLFATILLSCLTKMSAQEIRLLNPHSLDPSGRFLHNGAFGSIFNIGSTTAKIDFVKAQNLIASYRLTTTPQLIVDINSLSNGNPASGGTT